MQPDCEGEAAAVMPGWTHHPDWQTAGDELVLKEDARMPT